jgi:transcriptional regulator with XRE-family HTH domain
MGENDATRSRRELQLAHDALGQAVRRAREVAGMSQTLLALQSSVSRTQLSIVERGAGRNPSLLALSRLACASGISIETFAFAFVTGSSALVPIRGSDFADSVAGAQRPPEGDAHAMGTVLRALRSDHGLNVTQLADQARMGLKHIMDLEQGRINSPGLSTLYRVANAVGGHDDAREVVGRRVALLARVYAGELRTAVAIRSSRGGA